MPNVYKLEPKDRTPLDIRDDGKLNFPTYVKARHIEEQLQRLGRCVESHKKWMKKREAILTAAEEYLRPTLQELNSEENRKLLAIGVESRLDDIEKMIKDIVYELEVNLKDFKYHTNYPPLI